MLRSSVCLVVLATSALACTASVTPVDLSGTPTPDPNGPTLGSPPPSSTSTPPPPPAEEKVTFGWSSVSYPSSGFSVQSIGGSSSSDVWLVGSDPGATSSTPWVAYHWDGSSWTSMTLPATKGRPSFGVASLGGSNVYLGFSYGADIYKLEGSTFTKKTSFSVTSGYTMAAVGSKIFVGTQENFGAGPLYVLDGSASKQAPVTEGLGGVNAVWGASDDDVWLGRSEGLGRLVGGSYQDVDATGTFSLSGTAKDDVWAVGETGVRHYDGKAWKSVTFPSGSGSSDAPRTVTALSKDEVIVTTYSNVYRWDGSAFVKESRSGAPTSSVKAARIGKEAWFVSSSAIARLAPAK